MRTSNILAIAAAALLAASPVAFAQQAMPSFVVEQEPDQKLSDSYIGASVVARSPEGTESVGTVSDLLLSNENKIVGVVVDVGGFLGIGAKPVGLSWTALQEEWSDGQLLLRTELTRITDWWEEVTGPPAPVPSPCARSSASPAEPRRQAALFSSRRARSRARWTSG